MAQPAAHGRGLVIDGGSVLAGIGLLVRLVAEVLELHIEVVGAEDVAELQEGDTGLLVAAGIDEGADLSVPASGETDEASSVGTQ